MKNKNTRNTYEQPAQIQLPLPENDPQYIEWMHRQLEKESKKQDSSGGTVIVIDIY